MTTAATPRSPRLPVLSPVRRIQAWLLAGCAALIASALWFQPPVLPGPPLTPAVGRAVMAMFVGWGLLWRALTLWQAGDTAGLRLVARPQPAPMTRRRWGMVALGLLALFVAAEASANQLPISALRRMSTHVQFFTLMAGIGLLVLGIGGAGSPPVRLRWPRRRRWEGVLLAAILAVALGLRLWRLNTSIAVLVDELHFVTGVLRLWGAPDVDLLSPMTNLSPFTWLYPYWQSWTMALLGRDLEGLRAVSAVLGTVSTAALWVLARSLFDRRTALVAALVFATFPPALHYGRIGIIQAGDATFGLLALAALAQGWRSGRRVHFALAGAMLGLSQYFYEGGRLMFPALLVGWVGWVWWCSRGGVGRRFPWGGLAALALTAAVVAAPVYYNLRVNDEALTMRLNSSGLSRDYWRDLLISTDLTKLGGFIEHASNTLLFYVNRPEHFIMYGGRQPLILTMFVPLFLVGVGVCLWRMSRRDAGAALPLGWVLLTSAGNALLVESYVSARYVVVFPALALLMAVGLRTAWDGLAVLLLPPRTRRDVRRWGVLFGVAACVVAGIQAQYYFTVHLPYFNEQFRDVRLYRDVEDAMLRAAQLPPGSRATLVMEYNFDSAYNRDFLRMLTDQVLVRTFIPENFDPADLVAVSREVDQAFFLVPDDAQTLDALVAHFGFLPDIQFSPNPDVPRRSQYAMFVYPAQRAADAPAPPLDARIDTRYRLDLAYVLAFVFMCAVAAVGVAQRERVWAGWRGIARRGGAAWGWVSALATRPGATRIAGWLVVPLLVAAAVGFRPGGDARLGIAAAAGAFAAWSILTRGTLAFPPDAFAVRRVPARLAAVSLRRYALVAGICALALLALVNVVGPADEGRALAGLLRVAPSTQLALLAGGAVLVGAGLAGGTVPDRAASVVGRLNVRRPEALAVLVIVALALAVRVIDLEYAVHRFVDELHSAAAVADLREPPAERLLTPHGQVTAFTWVYPQLQAWAYEVYGPTLTALRVVSALAGTLTVLALWWFGRVLFMPAVGVIAALALAVFPPHIHFSRLGLNNVADPLFGVLALGLLVRGVREDRPGYLAWAGVMLGLSQYFYEGGRLLYPAVAVGWLLWARPTRAQAVRFGAAFAVVAAPLYYTLWALELPALPRLEAEAASRSDWSAIYMRGPLAAPVALANALLEPLTHVVYRPDQSWFFGGESALIPWLVLPAFLLGVFTLVRGARRSPGRVLLLVWMGLTLAGTALLHERAHSARMVVLHPALMLVVALGVMAGVGGIARGRAPLRRVSATALVAGVVLVVAAAQVGWYFGRHLPQYRADYYTSFALDDVLFRAGTLPDDTLVHVVTPLVVREYSITSYLRYRGRQNAVHLVTISPQGFDDAYLQSLSTSRPHAFFIPEGDRVLEIRISQYFAVEGPYTSPYGRLAHGQFWLYYAPPR